MTKTNNQAVGLPATPDGSKTIPSLPGPIHAQLTSCPTTGHGVHLWLFHTARALHQAIDDHDVILQLLEQAVKQCGRTVTSRELEQAVTNSDPAKIGCTTVNRQPPWPERDEAKILEIVADGFTVERLCQRSPVQFNDGDPHTEEIIDVLFPNNPLLCVGLESHIFDTRPRERWRGLLANQQLIVPSAMTAIIGKTQDGRSSKHTLNNTGRRLYLVVEFDNGGLDQHAALLWYLSYWAPLALVVFSGSKSLHGWFSCGSQKEDTLHRFMRLAISLGADKATWTKSQFVRIPDGLRSNGKRQAVIFFNPKAVEVQ